MRAIVQRVLEASVTIDGKLHSNIDKGLLVFLAVHNDDQDKDLEYILDKVLNMRIFTDENGKMNKSVLDVGAQILVVSQFTLFGDIRKGRRPSFTESAKPEKATYYYELFLEKLRESVETVKSGVFAEDMKVSLINDGPVTIQLDSTKIY
ncbi:MAG: D-tyrosyl-tRNA(Tyr) deacylase [Tissierellia bacterium]|nr:D-tyrosyl-tRNA(Tyr) deacylase [Tissierellia bacterium]